VSGDCKGTEAGGSSSGLESVAEGGRSSQDDCYRIGEEFSPLRSWFWAGILKAMCEFFHKVCGN